MHALRRHIVNILKEMDTIGSPENAEDRKPITVRGMPGWAATFNWNNMGEGFKGVLVFINDDKRKWIAGIYSSGILFYKSPQDTFITDQDKTFDPRNRDSIKQAMRYVYLKMQTPNYGNSS